MIETDGAMFNETYRRYFSASLVFADAGASVESVMIVFDFIIRKYVQARNQGRDSFVATAMEIADELKEIKYNTIKEALNSLARYGVVRAGMLPYDRKYEFPNKTIENSYLGAYAYVEKRMAEWRWSIPSQSELTESAVANRGKPVPLVHFNKHQYYQQNMLVVMQSSHVSILSNTPGLILTTEYDDGQNPYRKPYYDTLIDALKKGRKVRYLINKAATMRILESYADRELDKVVAHADKFLRFGNLQARYMADTYLPGMVISDSTAVVGVKDESLDPEHSIRGQAVYDRSMRKVYENCFEKEWKEAEEAGQIVDIDFVKKMVDDVRNERM